MRRLGGLLFLGGLGYFAILELSLVAAVLYWPDFLAGIEGLMALARPLPVVGDMLEGIDEFGFYAYVAGQHYFKGGNLLGSVAAVMFAVGTVAGDAHRGTLEIVLARPISRRRILTERFIAGFVAFALPTLAATATIPWLATTVDEYVDYSTALLGAAHQIAFLSVVYGLTTLLSTIASNPTKIALAVLLPMGFSYAMYFVKDVTHYSPLRLTDMYVFVEIEETQALDWTVCGPMLGVTAFLFVAAQICFARRVP